MATIGNTIITTAGINAILNAQTNGTTIQPKYYKVTADDIPLDAWLTDISNPWRTADIDQYAKIDENTVQFKIDIAPDEALNYGITFGLFLADGTLFAVAKPPAPFPPNMRQVFTIQISYSNIEQIIDFTYIPIDEEEQSLTIMQVAFDLSTQIYNLIDRVNLIEQFDNLYPRTDKPYQNNQVMTTILGDIDLSSHSTQGLILKDRTTGIRYRLGIDNGNLILETVE